MKTESKCFRRRVVRYGGQVGFTKNATVRLVYGRMLIDNWATVAFDLPGKKRRGVKEAA